jgi:hypothetical protein
MVLSGHTPVIEDYELRDAYMKSLPTLELTLRQHFDLDDNETYSVLPLLKNHFDHFAQVFDRCQEEIAPGCSKARQSVASTNTIDSAIGMMYSSTMQMLQPAADQEVQMVKPLIRLPYGLDGLHYLDRNNRWFCVIKDKDNKDKTTDRYFTTPAENYVNMTGAVEVDIGESAKEQIAAWFRGVEENHQVYEQGPMI